LAILGAGGRRRLRGDLVCPAGHRAAAPGRTGDPGARRLARQRLTTLGAARTCRPAAGSLPPQTHPQDRRLHRPDSPPAARPPGSWPSCSS